MRVFGAVAILALLAAAAAGQTAAERVRVEVEASPRRVWAGERVTLTYRLVTSAPRAASEPETLPGLPAPRPPGLPEAGLLIRDIRVVREPRFPNFWVSEIEIDRDDPDLAEAQGRNVHPLRQLRLFPLTAGRLRIDPAAFGMRVFPDSIETLDAGPQDVLCETEPVEVEARALPQAGRPPTFGGAVGQFALSATAATAGARAGQVLRFEIEIRGDGNVEATGAPYFAPVDGVRASEPRRVSADLGLAGEDELARAVWVVDIVPERAGTFTIGPFTLDSFNPDTNRYETARSNAVDVAVLERLATLTPPPMREAPSRVSWIWIPAAIAAGLLAVGLAAAIMRGRGKRVTAPAAEPAPAAPAAGLAQLRTRLKRAIVRAEESRRDGDARALHSHLLVALGDLTAELYGLPPAALTRETLAERLISRGIAPDLVERTVNLFDRCQTASFSPAAPDVSRSPIEEAVRLFEDLARRA